MFINMYIKGSNKMKRVILSLILAFSVTMILSGRSEKQLTPEEQKAAKIQSAESQLYSEMNSLASGLSPKKWHRVTKYKTKQGGCVFYLGTNTLNGLAFYWSGDLNSLEVQALDPYSAEQLGTKMYEGSDKENIVKEWESSEEAKALDASDPVLQSLKK